MFKLSKIGKTGKIEIMRNGDFHRIEAYLPGLVFEGTKIVRGKAVRQYHKMVNRQVIRFEISEVK